MFKFTKIAAAAVTIVSSALIFAAPVSATVIYDRSDTAFGSAASLIILLCVCVVSVLVLGLKIYLVIDATKRDYGQDQNMLVIGILILLFLGFPIGDIIYWALIMNKYPKKN